MLKVKKLIAIVLTVTILSTLCVFVNVGAATEAVTLLDKNFNDQNVSNVAATADTAGFKGENGEKIATVIGEDDYGVKNSTKDDWWMLMKLPQLVKSGKLTFEYSLLAANSKNTVAYLNKGMPTGESVSGFEKKGFFAGIYAGSGDNADKIYMSNFNDAMQWANTTNVKELKATGKNIVKVVIDFNASAITTYLNGETVMTKTGASWTSTGLATNGVGGFAINAKNKDAVFDDFSIVWERPVIRTDAVTLLDKNFNNQNVSNVAATAFTAGFKGENGERIKAEIGAGDYGVKNNASDDWWLLMKLPQLVKSGKLTFEYSLLAANSKNTVAYLNKGMPKVESVSGFGKKGFFAGIYAGSGDNADKIYMSNFNDAMQWANTTNVKELKATGKNIVKVVIDFNASAITTYLNGETVMTKTGASWTSTGLATDGVGGFAINAKNRDAVFDDFSIVWEIPLTSGMTVSGAPSAGEEITLSIDVNKLDNISTAVLLGAVYNSDNVMVAGATADVVWDTITKTATVTIDIPATATGTLTLKGFLWDSLGNLKPLTESF